MDDLIAQGENAIKQWIKFMIDKQKGGSEKPAGEGESTAANPESEPSTDQKPPEN
jgi:hypothetical protein